MTARRATFPKSCVVCGVEVWRCVNEHVPSRFCSHACYSKHRKGAGNARPIHTCEACGGEYRPRNGDGRGKRYCSRRCFFKARELLALANGRSVGELQRLRIAWNARPYAKHRSRARYFGCDFVPFNRALVFERDGWVCGICHLPIDPTLKHPHRMSVSLDHIHPMSKGGRHATENCQAAHLTCNSHKQAKLNATPRAA